MLNTENFTGRAENYAIGRPGYPKNSIDYICSMVSPSDVFCDIGAGTGKFVINLAERGYSIFAVEPNADMRNQCIVTLSKYDNAKLINGAAETTTLDDHCVDVITVAHALHWFNLKKFYHECQRIIKPGGLIVVIYNIIPGPNGTNMQNISKKVTDEFLNNPTISEFSNPMDYKRDTWLAYIMSQEENPLPNDPEYAEHVAKIYKNFDCNSVNGILHIDRITKVYSERIL
jgi:ubiquinone/menaquinone biosynthesis C-methylase UbiE